MPIASSDIKVRLTGGAANANVNASLGGAKSSVEVVDNTLHNLFDVVSGAESTAGDVEYRCVCIHNAHATLSMLGTKVWISTDTPSSDTAFAIAAAGEGLNGTAETVANENTAPAGESFSTPTTEGAALSLGDIPAGQHYAIWLRRTVTAGAAAYSNDGATLTIKCDTEA